MPEGQTAGPVVVIADDLTGAAELAGAAINRGLSAEVATTWDRLTGSNCDVLCLDTGSRSLAARAASRIVSGATGAALGIGPSWIYKKCDSVLRGNVLAEVEAIRATAGFSNTLLVPANPSKGRVIQGGRYLIGGEPLDRTEFANDPEYPRRTSDVQVLLGARGEPVATPDATSASHLESHAASLGSRCLPAGGVEFFEALLHERIGPPDPRRSRVDPPYPTSGLPALVVCGSAAAWNSGRREQCEASGGVVMTMPQELVGIEVHAGAGERWAKAIVEQLTLGKTVLAAIGRPDPPPVIDPASLADRFASAVSVAIEAVPVRGVYAEGGATAAAVAKASGWTRFTAARQLAGGEVELRPHAPGTRAFDVKVGSYPWPSEVW